MIRALAGLHRDAWHALSFGAPESLRAKVGWLLLTFDRQGATFASLHPRRKGKPMRKTAERLPTREVFFY